MHRHLYDRTHLWVQLERVMKSLFLRRLFIWPRYEAGVKSTLEGHECEVRHRSVRHLHDHTCIACPLGRAEAWQCIAALETHTSQGQALFTVPSHYGACHQSCADAYLSICSAGWAQAHGFLVWPCQAAM